ncbi:ABC transporter ATP-binding protein [Haloimpatiens sp. FM7330]|uniref:ABC transporter ATP-binding protein n=1 Tax=Haloimpatiens sp. FM7330 TaxID=3298610 RepID=UPI003640B384
MSVLELEEVYKIYGDGHGNIALKNINLAVEKGEFLGIMGPSGSGKTTLINAASTINKVSAGKVYIDGFDMSNLNKEQLALMRREKIGFVFQDFRLIDTLSVKENIMLPLILEKVEFDEIHKRLTKLESILCIKDLMNKNIHKLSGGEKQKVAIARAVIHNPSILFADEPTGRLDSASTKVIMDLFKNINEEFNITIVMVTHDSRIASYCSRVLFLKDGEIYNEMYKGEERDKFYKRIIDVVSFLGGKTYDI